MMDVNWCHYGDHFTIHANIGLFCCTPKLICQYISIWGEGGGSKITADGDCSHAIKRCLLLGRKIMTNLDSILKSIDITLPTNVNLVKVMIFS